MLAIFLLNLLTAQLGPSILFNAAHSIQIEDSKLSKEQSAITSDQTGKSLATLQQELAHLEGGHSVSGSSLGIGTVLGGTTESSASLSAAVQQAEQAAKQAKAAAIAAIKAIDGKRLEISSTDIESAIHSHSSQRYRTAGMGKIGWPVAQMQVPSDPLPPTLPRSPQFRKTRTVLPIAVSNTIVPSNSNIGTRKGESTSDSNAESTKVALQQQAKQIAELKQELEKVEARSTAASAAPGEGVGNRVGVPVVTKKRKTPTAGKTNNRGGHLLPKPLVTPANPRLADQSITARPTNRPTLAPTSPPTLAPMVGRGGSKLCGATTPMKPQRKAAAGAAGAAGGGDDASATPVVGWRLFGSQGGVYLLVSTTSCGFSGSNLRTGDPTHGGLPTKRRDSIPYLEAEQTAMSAAPSTQSISNSSAVNGDQTMPASMPQYVATISGDRVRKQC